MKTTQRIYIAAMSLCLITTAPNTASAVSVSGQGTWETTLQGRDLDGDLSTFEAYYDTVLDISWLADTNYAGTMMNWAAANTWAANLNINGVTGWRLPTVSPIDGTTADDGIFSYTGAEDQGYSISAPGTLYAGSTANEMAYLFYNTLGNKAYCNPATSSESTCTGPQSGYGLSNTGPFSNFQPTAYWSGTEFAPNTNYAWYFKFFNGAQEYYPTSHTLSASWAVHSGDVGVSAVPVPAAVWLFSSGLFGLIGLNGKRRGC